MLDAILALILLSIPFILTVTAIFMCCRDFKIFKYRKLLNKAKANYKHQSLTFRLFRDILPYTEKKFIWGDEGGRHFATDEILLWYVTREPCKPPYDGYYVHQYVVDIPYWKTVLFRICHKRYLKRKSKSEQNNAVIKNETNEILFDVQRTIEKKIDQNNQIMRQAAITQQQVLQRLTPFEEDYIKSQVNVEV